MPFLITTLFTLFTQAALAVSPGSLLTYEGVLTDSGGTPITSPQTVTFSVLYGSCVLYSETQSITPGSVGEFSVVVGTGTRTDTTNNTADRIFASAGSVNCQSASAVSMSGFTTRALRINVAGTDLTPDVTIGNIPVSINSQKLADKGPSDFLQVNAALGTTQSNLESILARFTSLDSLLTAYTGGTLTAQSATNFTGSLAGDVGGTQGATVVNRIKGVNLDMTGLTSGKILKYNGTAFSVADDNTGTLPSDASYVAKGIVQFDTNVSISGMLISSGVARVNVGTSADQIVKLDSMGKLPAVDGSALINTPKEIPAGATSGQVLSSTGSTLQWITPSSTDSTKLPLAGGTMSGAIEMGSNNMTNVGFITMSPNKSLHLSNNSADPSLSTADKGKVWFNSTTNQIKYWDGSSTQALGVAGSGLTSLNGLTGSTQTFGTIGTSGTVPNWSSASSIHTLNIPLASGAGVTAGLLSKSDYDAFNAKQATGNYITALTGDVSATGPGSVAATISNGVITTAKIADGTVTATDMNFTGINSGTSSLVLKDSTGKFSDFNCSTAGQIPTWTISGFTCQTPTALLPTLADSRIWVGNGSAIATAVPVSGDATLSNTGALTLVTVGSGGSGVSKITFDTKGRVTTGSALISSDITTILGYTPVNKAGDTMTGSLGFANYTMSSETTMTGGLTISDKGKTWYNSTTNQIKFWDGSTAQTLGVAGSGVTNVSGTSPISVTNGSTTPNISVATATASSLGVMQAGSGLSVASGTVSVVSAPDLSTIASTGIVQRTGAGAYTALGVLAPLNVSGSSLGLTYGSGLFLNTGTLQVDSGTTANKIVALNSSAQIPAVDGSLLTNISAGNISGTVSITKGGTGATTATTAFNALSPLTTKGDLLTHSGSTNTRLPAGTDGQLLVADSVSANGMKWFAPPFFKNGGNTFGSDALLGTTDAYNLNLMAGGVSKMSVTPSGNVVVGTGTPIVSGGNTGPGVITLHGGGASVTDAGAIEMTNPIASVANGTLGGKLNFNVINNAGNKTVVSIQGIAEGSGGANGYGGRMIFQTKVDNATSNQVAMVIASSGFIGMGNSAPAYKLDVNGDINVANGFVYRVNGVQICSSTGCTTSSDRNLKENIIPLENSLENILKLEGVAYQYRDKTVYTDKDQIGVIAQDVEKVFPQVVITDKKTGFKAVAYDHLVAPLIEAVKSLYARLVSTEESVANHERRLASLEDQKVDHAEIEKLKKENEELKKQNEKLEKDLNLIKSHLGL
ncbi:tail fiber domain-containing protein [Bdellovibrio sp. HCB290]|uniref:tail fiber domain-containing protein n=1 Tax=Bdellovibrio sp. HCB290 TaxID=3394356 RepID=UPI0039B39620